MTRLIYVRHGESNTTVGRIIGGPRTCSGLSPLGVMQAERLRDRWTAAPEFTPDVLISSHFPRARQTAEIIGQAFPDLEVETVAGFGEHDPGPECDGMTMDDYVSRFGSWSTDEDPFGVVFPGGETIAAFHYRVGMAVRETVDRFAGKTIVVACHGGVIDAVLRQALKTAPSGAFWINTLNTSVTELVRTNETTWSLRRYGDTAHLVGLPSATPHPA